MSLKTAFAGTAAALVVLATTMMPAAAKCTRLGFSVNDYGKDGPTKDAKSLLDKYIADWTAQRGIKKYTTGKKDVSCELFLDFGFFDEHTCKAAATVCWGGEGGGSATQASAKAKSKAKNSDITTSSTKSKDGVTMGPAKTKPSMKKVPALKKKDKDPA